MKAASTPEKSVDNHFTRQYIPEDNSELHTRRREKLKSHSSPWWWRQYAPLKRRSTIILHGSTSKKTILNFILAAMRTWNLTHRPDDGGSTHLWNVGQQLFYTAVHPRRQFWTSYSPPWELEISYIISVKSLFTFLNLIVNNLFLFLISGLVYGRKISHYYSCMSCNCQNRDTKPFPFRGTFNCR
jgi:hypothetical protein